jgi:hypothetical protein
MVVLTPLEVWQNLAIFSSRLIGSAVEALLTTKVVNRQLSAVLPIVSFFVAPCKPRHCY